MENMYVLLVTYDQKIPYQLFTDKAYYSVKECEEDNGSAIKKLKELHGDKVWFRIKELPIFIQWNNPCDMSEKTNRAKFVSLSNCASFYIGGILTMIPEPFKKDFYKISNEILILMEKIQKTFKE
jgi:hypothetical protein